MGHPSIWKGFLSARKHFSLKILSWNYWTISDFQNLYIDSFSLGIVNSPERILQSVAWGRESSQHPESPNGKGPCLLCGNIVLSSTLPFRYLLWSLVVPGTCCPGFSLLGSVSPGSTLQASFWNEDKQFLSAEVGGKGYVRLSAIRSTGTLRAIWYVSFLNLSGPLQVSQPSCDWSFLHYQLDFAKSANTLAFVFQLQ